MTVGEVENEGEEEGKVLEGFHVSALTTWVDGAPID